MTYHVLNVESSCGRVLESFTFGSAITPPRIGESYISDGMHYKVTHVSTEITPSDDSSELTITTRLQVSNDD